MKTKKILIIAEVGCNHNGNFRLAIKHIDEAKKVGANAVKFQIFKPCNLVTKNAIKAPYALKNTKKFKSQFEMQKKLMLDFNLFKKIKRHCYKKKIKFLCSAFDIESLDYLKQIGLRIFKIPSGEINNIPYIKHISNFKCETILSTGMSTISEISKAYRILNKNISKKNIALLHCVSMYPTSLKSINLNTIGYLKKKFDTKIGLSDHTKSTLVPALAVTMGAEIIEKHFTLNNKLKGPDHEMSLNPRQFKKMVENIKAACIAMGNKGKILSYKELSLKRHARKSIVASQKIKKGEIFNYQNLTIKRPGIGIEPDKIYTLIGKKSARNYDIDDLIIK